MRLQVTNTFYKTIEAYKNPLYRNIVSMGGSRSSKSYSILQLFMVLLMMRVNLKITAWRDTKVTCRATILEDFKNIISFDDTVYSNFKENKQSGTFLYKPTKSKIIFEGADDIGKVLGSAQDISFFNEVTEFSKSVSLQITQRTAERVFYDYNPSKDFWLEKYRGNENSVFIHSTFRDNAFCPTPIVKQLLSYEPWEVGSYEIVDSVPFYKGKPITEINQPPPNIKNINNGTADVYLWLVYGLGIGAEKPNRIYRGWNIISKEDFDDLLFESYFVIDFGSKNPTAIIELKFNGDDTFFVKPLFYRPLTDIESSLSSILRKIPTLNKSRSLIIADSAKPNYIESLKNEGFLVMGAIKGSDSVSAGISIVQSFNIEYVFDDEFDTEYKTYSWEIDRYDKPTDKPVKKDDHYMDDVRYGVHWIVNHLGVRM